MIFTSIVIFLLLQLCHGLNNSRRREFLSTAAASLLPLEAIAEALDKTSNCDSRNCWGVKDGLLENCPHGLRKGAGCASSQDDTPGNFAEPWDYSENNELNWEVQQKRLLPAIELATRKRNNDSVQLVLQEGRYTRVVFTDGKTNEKSFGEFYFTPEDTTVQFRLASSDLAGTSLLSTSNLNRAEDIRKQLGYLKLPVLRNRKRAFIFGESQLDSFGPGYTADMPSPAEMTSRDFSGRFVDSGVDPRLKIDLVQQFPGK